jgi:hypothetical protein
VGPRAGLDGWENSRPPPGFHPRIVRPVAGRYTDCANPAHVGTQGNGYGNKHEDFFNSTLQNLAATLFTTKSNIKQVNVLPTQCTGVF